MQWQYRSPETASEPPLWLRFVGRHLRLFLFLILSFNGMLLIYYTFSPVRGQAEAVTAAISRLDRMAPIFKPAESRPILQRLPQSRAPVRIGLIVGHLDSDSGTVCEDGLTEVDVTTDIVERLVAILAEAGVTSELLTEFDPRLAGYDATALVSVHADSCQYVGEHATGFKIASSPFTDSSALEECIESAYQAETGLAYHANTITPHMTDYHAFRKIAPGVPAVIIEVGFMNRDRALLTEGADRPASGLAKGIICYLEAGP